MKILKNRVKLINAMYKCIYDCDWEDYRNYFLRIVSEIRKNTNHLLSLSQDDEMKISYACNEAHKYDSNRRIKMTLQKYLTRNIKDIKDALDDNTIEVFSNTVMAIARYDLVGKKIKELKGYDIVKHYHESKVYSCMVGHKSHLTELYAENPQKVSLITFDNLRALVWKCDDGTKALDRIYPSGHWCSKALLMWAAKNDYVLKDKEDRLDERRTKLFKDNSVKVVTLKKPKHGNYPYIDTFQYGRFTKKKVILTNEDNDRQEAKFDCTDGSFNIINNCYQCSVSLKNRKVHYRGNSKYCSSCIKASKVCSECNSIIFDRIGAYAPKKIFGKYYCYFCVGTKFRICHSCSGIFNPEDVLYINSRNYCRSCYKDHFIKCDICHEYYEFKGMMKFDKENICKYCVRLCYNHEYYYSNCKAPSRKSLNAIIHPNDTNKYCLYCRQHRKSIGLND